MNGEMNQKKKATHCGKLVDNGGKYYNPETLCGWTNPKRIAWKPEEVTCPDCKKLLEATNGR